MSLEVSQRGVESDEEGVDELESGGSCECEGGVCWGCCCSLLDKLSVGT